MSESPRATADAEEQATSTNSAAEAQQSQDENETQDMNAGILLGESGEGFEVKEQDRWLPIANGK